MRVCFYTLGCKVNLNETGALEQMFRANGFTIAQENEPADVFVVNSCTVTNFGDQKSRKWLRRKKREDRKSTRLNSSHREKSRMPSSA